jgi:uncharacterized surface protein with fasciclin (FAS1) repeats
MVNVMKKLIYIVLIFLNASVAFAQKADSLASVKVKTKNIDGTVMTSAKDIIENISLSPEFTKLDSVIKAADLVDSFKSGTITFFAPNNKAFDKLAPGMLDTLLRPAHKADLVNLLNYHAVSGKIASKDLERQIKAGNGQATLTTISGGVLTARINENRNIVLTDENGDQSVITRLDIEQSNGMLFIVNAVLLLKAKQ